MTAAAELNIAVIGFGKLGLLHAGIVNGLPGSRLSALVDTSSIPLDLLKSRMPDVRIFDDHRKMLNDGDIDAVFIASPTDSHVPTAMDCVQASVPVFIEKPLAVSAEQARPLRDALAGKALPNMVGYMGRYIGTFRHAKKIIDTGALGTPQMLRSSMYVEQLFKKGKGWRYDKEKSGGGVLITQNAHVVDKLLWMFGDIDWVSGLTGNLYSETVEDYVHAYFSFSSGLVGYLDASWSARHFRTPAIAIHVQGTNGTLDVTDDDVRLFLVDSFADLAAGWSRWRKPDLYGGVTFDVGGPQYSLQAEDFLAAVRDGGLVESDVESAYRVQCVIDALYRSAEFRGASVNVSDMM